MRVSVTGSRVDAEAILSARDADRRWSPALVCDASALAALLLDAGAAGSWVTEQISSATLLAPNLAPFATANVIRAG